MPSPTTPLTPGMRVLCRDAEWLVTQIHSASSHHDQQVVYCLGTDDLNRGHEAAFLTQLDTITPVDPRKTRLLPDDSGRYLKARLFLEAQLRQMPLTDPEPHVDDIGAFTAMDYQKQAVQRAIGQLRPRLLLADAVGLGKTIEVGMILAELVKRGQANRILVLAKKSMLAQFQAELWNRFALPLVRLDSLGLSRLQLKIPASKNPFEVYHRIIMSIDTLKDIGRYSHFLEQTRWDVVVIDEAHNVAGGSNPERHLSFRLARRLARRTNSLLLTTATPHNGKRETFGRLISLLDPSAVPDPRLQRYEAEDIRPFFLMRFKEDVREEAGENFQAWEVVPLSRTSIRATPEEEQVYAALVAIRDGVTTGRIGSIAIVQWGMYKAFLSSPEACASTVAKRLKQLRGRDGAEAEIQALTGLQQHLAGRDIAGSSRFRLLLDCLAGIGWTGTANSPRVLLFTESRLTQDALLSALAGHFKLSFDARFEAQPGQVLAMMHGGMPDTDLAATVESFGTGNSPMRLMVATDVASEGVNLHHQCHQIIHYDLPWSIITLIQRNGRIDRFGQTRSPVIRYLLVESEQGLLQGDREIFQRLVAKVEEINRSTRSGESVLRLYDADKEENYIAGGLVRGDVEILEKANPESAESRELEDTLLAAAQTGHEDFLAFLTGAAPAPESNTGETPAPDNSRLRLMAHGDFLKSGYQILASLLPDEHFPPLEETPGQLILDPPRELQRRLGAPGSGGEVVFGATAIPEETWPADRRFHLSTDTQRVERAIRAALAQRGQWSEELLLTELHPLMQWLAERLSLLMERDTAPLIASPHLEPGELLFCFIGQVSSRAETPLLVDAHSVSFRKGGHYRVQPLVESLKAVRFDELANSGQRGKLPEALLAGFVKSAAEQSLMHMQTLKNARQKLNEPRLKDEEARLQRWFERWAARIEEQLAGLAPDAKPARQLRQRREEMEKYLQDRTEHWLDAHFRATEQPTTRLVLAVEGIR